MSFPDPPNSMSFPPSPRRMSAWSADATIGRQLEDLTAKVDEIEISASIFAEGRRTVHRADIRDDLRGALGGDPRAAIEAQGEDLALNEVGEEILALQRFALAAIDISAGDRMPDGVIVA